MSRPVLRTCLRLAVIVLLLPLLPAAIGQESSFLDRLTEEERAFVTAHPVIRVGGEMDWAPYDFVDRSGRHGGVSAQYLSILEKKLGVKFEVRTGQTWKDLLDSIRSRELDILPAIWKTEDRQEFLEFTTAYAECVDFIFVR